MKKYILIFIAISVLYPQDYIGKQSIGKVKIKSKKENRPAFTYLPIENWVGETFIFIPKSKSLQGEYIGWYFNESQRYTGVPYKDLVGKKVVVVEVDEYDFIKVKLSDGRYCYGSPYLGTMSDITLIDDIDSARARWLNKKFHFKKDILNTYDSRLDKFGEVHIEPNSVVTIIDIVLSWDNYRPARFVIETSQGEQGFVDVNLSGTNSSETIRNRDRFWNFFWR